MKQRTWMRKVKDFLLREMAVRDAPFDVRQLLGLSSGDAPTVEELERLGMKSGGSILDSRAQASLQLAYRGVYSIRFYSGSDFGVGVYMTCNEQGYAEGELMTVYVRMLEHKSPHLYFDNKRNNHWFRRNFPENISKAQLVPCEGYISDRYDLYAPEGYALDALVIGAPDVLDAFDRLNMGGDIEVLGDQLYMIFPKHISLKDKLEELVKNGAELAKEVDDNLSRYRDERAISFGQPIGYAGQRIIRK